VFYGKAEVVSLEYTAIGAAHLGEVINASITLRVHVLNLIAVDELSPACLDDLNSQERFEEIFSSVSNTESFRQYNLQPTNGVFHPDYGQGTVRLRHVPGRARKLLVSTDRHYTLSGMVIQQRANNAEYERIGFLFIDLRTPVTMNLEDNNGDPEESDGDLEKSKRDSEADEKERIDNLLRSLPVEEVTIL
jgi:hypothetical protein